MPLRQWVCSLPWELLLGPEFGGSGAITSRWTKSPRVSVFSATAEERADLDAVVAELGPLLAPRTLTVGPDEDPTADVEVHFVPLASFGTVAKRGGFDVVPGNLGFFWTWWNDAHQLTKAYVLIAEDRLDGAKRRHFVFEETTQAMGLSNDSELFPDSVFFSKGKDGGAATSLSALDKQLVKFFYTSVAPGSNEAALDAALDRGWPP